VSYGVKITAGGVDYSFVLDTEQGVRELVENSMRVTSVRVWDENVVPMRELSHEEVSQMMRFDENDDADFDSELTAGLRA
jgi:hypothetical protein